MVKQITIISGKGGTGKTTITSSFAALADNAVLADCDVDAADMHLILQPDTFETHDFYGLELAHINKDLCTGCDTCVLNCRFDAILESHTVDPYRCEGCGVCEYVCPETAIVMKEKKAGEYYCSHTRFGPLVHAKLGIGEEASGKLVSNVRQRASEIAEISGKELIIIDGPPGTGCSVIAAMTGTDLVLVVTEPTVSGIHDLDRVLQVARHFRIPVAVCINKCDLNPEMSHLIFDHCAENGVNVVGRIPYNRMVIDAMLEGKTIVENPDNELSGEIGSMWSVLLSILGDNNG